ncbi:MAG: hypothetical protein RMJ56_09695 [Gemmataceae bacterium]|nr:hypothetical protein [Gemmata sp.]MDW8197862.1 hypothetical protein [Gemmataceae bacterium]
MFDLNADPPVRVDLNMSSMPPPYRVKALPDPNLAIVLHRDSSGVQSVSILQIPSGIFGHQSTCPHPPVNNDRQQCPSTTTVNNARQLNNDRQQRPPTTPRRPRRRFTATAGARIMDGICGPRP